MVKGKKNQYGDALWRNTEFWVNCDKIWAESAYLCCCLDYEVSYLALSGKETKFDVEYAAKLQVS